MPSYSQSNPPIIIHNLGSNSWPNMNGTAIPTLLLFDVSGNPIAVDTGSMTKVPNTPEWMYVLEDRVIAGIPATATSWLYIITSGPGGSVVADGSIKIVDSISVAGSNSISDHRLICPQSILLPASVSTPKTMPIKFEAYSPSGEIAVLDSVAITISGVVTNGVMVSTSNLWQYNWTLLYNTTPQIHDVTVVATKGSYSVPFSTTVETHRAKEFNAVRLSSGIVM